MVQVNAFEVEVIDGEVYAKVPLEEYTRLEADSEWLSCLEEAGVDNWGGIEVAYSVRKQREEEN